MTHTMTPISCNTYICVRPHSKRPIILPGKTLPLWVIWTIDIYQWRFQFYTWVRHRQVSVDRRTHNDSVIGVGIIVRLENGNEKALIKKIGFAHSVIPKLWQGNCQVLTSCYFLGRWFDLVGCQSSSGGDGAMGLDCEPVLLRPSHLLGRVLSHFPESVRNLVMSGIGRVQY